MKKIAIVIAELASGGGAEKVAADLANEFSARQYDVAIITFANLEPHEIRYAVNARFIDLAIPERQGNLFFQVGLMLKRAWHFRRVFKKEGFDHIFSFLEAANAPCVIASRKVVVSIHSNPARMTRNEWRLFQWVYPRAKSVIAVSKQMQALLESKAGLKNVNCIYNPVNVAVIQEKSHESIAFDGDFILAVGRLEEPKRFDRLIEAFAKTKASQTCQLFIVGSGSWQSRLENSIQTLGLSEKVKLLGFDDNPYKYMARAKFLVMSSMYEGYPLVLIEALSLGCPLIATDCPTGPREIIQQGKNGLLVKNGNIGALAENIDALFFNEALRQCMSKYAPHSVCDNNIKVVADAWLSA